LGFFVLCILDDFVPLFSGEYQLAQEPLISKIYTSDSIFLSVGFFSFYYGKAVLLFPKNANLQDVDGRSQIGSGFPRR